MQEVSQTEITMADRMLSVLGPFIGSHKHKPLIVSEELQKIPLIQEAADKVELKINKRINIIGDCITVGVMPVIGYFLSHEIPSPVAVVMAPVVGVLLRRTISEIIAYITLPMTQRKFDSDISAFMYSEGL